MCHVQRGNRIDEVRQKLVGMHEYREVATVTDRNRLLARRFDGLEVPRAIDVGVVKSWFTLNGEHRNGKINPRAFALNLLVSGMIFSALKIWLSASSWRKRCYAKSSGKKEIGQARSEGAKPHGSA